MENKTQFILADNKVKLRGKKKQDQIKIPLDEIAGMLNWPEVLDQVKRLNGFDELIRIFNIYSKAKDSSNDSSKCWTLLATKNFDQLLEHGYNNFKRTIGLNYFTFLVQQNDPQIKMIETLFSKNVLTLCKNAALKMPVDPNFPAKEQFSYYYFVFLLWKYVNKIDHKRYLKKLVEPSEGNPILVSDKGKTMSQDLANSLIEYYSIHTAASFKKFNRVLEIGGGYGRNAYVILTLNPNIKMVLVDIMPALYIAQRYLSSIFKERKIFKLRNFSAYAEIKDEIEQADIVFLMPQQLALLPDKQFDLIMNISSFGEMNYSQVNWYLKQIDRLTIQYFYSKQWARSLNPFDDILIEKKDYPYPANWQEIYTRNCAVQTEFFETLYQVTIP